MNFAKIATACAVVLLALACPSANAQVRQLASGDHALATARQRALAEASARTVMPTVLEQTEAERVLGEWAKVGGDLVQVMAAARHRSASQQVGGGGSAAVPPFSAVTAPSALSGGAVTIWPQPHGWWQSTGPSLLVLLLEAQVSSKGQPAMPRFAAAWLLSSGAYQGLRLEHLVPPPSTPARWTALTVSADGRVCVAEAGGLSVSGSWDLGTSVGVQFRGRGLDPSGAPTPLALTLFNGRRVTPADEQWVEIPGIRPANIMFSAEDVTFGRDQISGPGLIVVCTRDAVSRCATGWLN